MDLQQIEKLVQIIENSSMLEFSIQEGDTKIKMSRRGTMGRSRNQHRADSTCCPGRGRIRR